MSPGCERGLSADACFLFSPHPRAQGKTQQNHKLTDFYPVRRSSRKSKAELQVEGRGGQGGPEGSARRAGPWLASCHRGARVCLRGLGVLLGLVGIVIVLKVTIMLSQDALGRGRIAWSMWWGVVATRGQRVQDALARPAGPAAVGKAACSFRGWSVSCPEVPVSGLEVVEGCGLGATYLLAV